MGTPYATAETLYQETVVPAQSSSPRLAPWGVSAQVVRRSSGLAAALLVRAIGHVPQTSTASSKVSRAASQAPVTSRYCRKRLALRKVAVAGSATTSRARS